MKKKILLSLLVSTCLLLAACQGKDPAGGGASSEEIEATTEITSEVTGEFESENFDEETGEILEEFEIESEVTPLEDVLNIKLSDNSTSGYEWRYMLENEDLVELEVQNHVEDNDPERPGSGRTYFTFRAKEAGTSKLYFFYLEPEAKLDIPEGENPEDYSDMSLTLEVTADEDGNMEIKAS